MWLSLWAKPDACLPGKQRKCSCWVSFCEMVGILWSLLFPKQMGFWSNFAAILVEICTAKAQKWRGWQKMHRTRSGDNFLEISVIMGLHWLLIPLEGEALTTAGNTVTCKHLLWNFMKGPYQAKVGLPISQSAVRGPIGRACLLLFHGLTCPCRGQNVLLVALLPYIHPVPSSMYDSFSLSFTQYGIIDADIPSL